MGDIDPAFVQTTHHKPSLPTSEADGIPVIDLSISRPEDQTRVVSEIADACKKWGFFQVVNHGVSLELRRRIEAVTKEFFDQPMEEKRTVRRNEAHPMGYYESEYTKNVRDWKEIFDFVLKDPSPVYASPEDDDEELRELTNQWPQNPPQFREICEEYAQEMEKLAWRLLELICLGLGIEANRLHGYFKDQMSFLRLNHYPSCPVPHLALGAGPHKDPGAFTILGQGGVSGLEVRRRSDGEWIPVKPTPDAYVLNVGDCMQVWSNDIYESAEHRVIANSEKERFSIPFFLMPSYDAVIKPVDELLSDQNPAKFRGYKMGKFVAARNSSNYKKLHVENIQIGHFRI